MLFIAIPFMTWIVFDGRVVDRVAWGLGRRGGRGGRWAACKHERQGERDGCEFGRLGDERDRLDPFRRSGESWYTHGYEQCPRCDLAEAEEPGEESDARIVWT